MKRRNAIAIQAGGYTISGSFATASAVSLLTGKGFSSLFYGALSALTAAGTNELAADMVVDQPAVTGSSSEEPAPTTAGAKAPTAS